KRVSGASLARGISVTSALDIIGKVVIDLNQSTPITPAGGAPGGTSAERAGSGKEPGVPAPLASGLGIWLATLEPVDEPNPRYESIPRRSTRPRSSGRWEGRIGSD
ncbi:MAG TPA: hypothetical protein VMP10_02210, partial [Chloroflexota bacterium]|nr:hypothetical protein [Chloroflexota bacterium]